ncbi:hypothetical protein Sulfitobl28_04610 [Sulfitobacter pontiacus]|nr:hypothetical protein Sulfitobl28_04610 [Sulfitobacter pontiacus]
MRLGPGLLYEGRTLQGARPKLADFCSATMAEFYSAVDTARDTFVTAGNVLQPAPAPRYSTHKTTPPRMPDGQTDTRTILAELGYDTDRIATILNAGGIA